MSFMSPILNRVIVAAIAAFYAVSLTIFAGMVAIISAHTERAHAAVEDIAAGRTIAGATQAADGQLVCFAEDDAARYRMYADEGDPAARSGELRQDLIDDHACVAARPGARFDRMADGRERFTTPHGTIDAWADEVK
jgi:hypothetical protein